MKPFTRCPTVCLRCGSLDHMAKDCKLAQQFGLSTEERDYAAEVRRDKQAVLALAVFLVLAHFLVAVWLGVEP